MNKTTTFYKFIGTQEDAKKYPDPEPIAGKEYIHEEFEKIVQKLIETEILLEPNHWESITKSEPIPVHEVLTKMDRIEILKVARYQKWTLKQIEEYVAFGTWPE